MKRNYILTLTVAIILGVYLGACNNNKGRGNNTGAIMGGTPTPDCLLNPNNYQGLCNFNYSAYQSIGFSNYGTNGYSNYGINNNYANGFCGCDINYSTPVYNNSWGLGCVNNQALQNSYTNNTFYPLTFTWNGSNQWMPAQYNYYAGSCSYNAVLACDLNMQGSCGPNATCTPIGQQYGGGYGGQSMPGICKMNGYNNNYYNNGYHY